MGKIRETLPSAAFKLNGSFLEDLVPGYHTLNARGKWTLEKELFTAEANIRSGAIFTNSRYPAREIEIEYFIEGSGWEALQAKYTALMGYLDTEDAQIIFNGESDKYVHGYFVIDDDIETDVITRSGRFKIVCMDPFKYSVTEHVVQAAGGVISVYYDGTYKAYPTLIAEFPATYDADGNNTNTSECGYVGYAKTDGSVLQFGDPEEVDWADVDKPATYPLNRTFRDLVGFTQNSATMINANYVQAGTASYYNNYGDTYYAYASAYGSGSNYHGPSIKTILTDVTNAKNFSMRFAHVFKATKAQFGCFQCMLWSSSGGGHTLVAGLNIVKTTKDTKAKVYVYGGSTTAKSSNTVNTADISLSWIKKQGNTLTFLCGNKKQTVKLDDSVADMIVDEVVFYFGKKGTSTAIGTNHLLNCTLMRTEYVNFENIPNSFMPGDVLTVETQNAGVLLDDGSATIPAQYLGALGNDWEDFCLTKGTNLIACDYSDFTTTAPVFSLKYRDRFI